MKTEYFFHIHKYTTSRLSAVVYSIGFDSPMNHLQTIEGELYRSGIQGEIVFDLLLSNGNTTDRFYSAFFDGEKLIEESIKKVLTPSSTIQKESLSFYHSKTKYLKNSVLNKAQRFLIKKNRALLPPKK